MTQRLIAETGISLDSLQAMKPGTEIGPFPQGFMVNPKVRRDTPNCGYPDAELLVQRHGDALGSEDYYHPAGLFGINNLLHNGSIGPKVGGQTAEEVMQELASDDHSAPGEINNLGE